MTATLEIKKDATISDCGKYRYRLSRIWEPGRPVATFVMLNPSTADATNDDATIRKCMGFARRWNLGGIHVGNLFAYRASWSARNSSWSKAARCALGASSR